MYHSTSRIMVPRVLDKAIRFGLCAAAPKRDYCSKRVQFQSKAAYASMRRARSIHRYTETPSEPSQPPVLVAKSRLSVQRAYMSAHQAAVRNRTPLGRCKTSRRGGKHDARLPERKGGRVLCRMSSLAYP